MITILRPGVLPDRNKLIEGQVPLIVEQNDVRYAMRDQWDGPHWRWWALAAGIVVVASTAAIALPIGLLSGRSVAGLMMLGLIIELLSISFVGAGMLDSMTRKMSQGGLTRDAADIDNDPTLSDDEKDRMKRNQQDQFDRRTLRAGIGVLPVLAAFFYLLFSQ